jgi:serine/threonine-protein kinase
MSFTTGTRIGPYEITSPLGEGGMGVVYRAHDTKLGRDVAIKALPDAFANDADRLQWFQREAQVLASLNHPNIAQIYGLEESDKTRCIVMELVEGETVQERLKRGPIPVEEALQIAKEIAEALETAHERGIIHRDLKPGNVMLTRDGKVKVLDFGLAKGFEQRQVTTLSNSPTLMSASVPGVILGTAAYMSPEQARGRSVDKRADIWAFGCVLYEMLTAKPVFGGETVVDTLAAIVERSPNLVALPAAVPHSIPSLLRQCLHKHPKDRLHEIADVRIALHDAIAVPEIPAAGTARKPAGLAITAAIVLGIAVLICGVLIARALFGGHDIQSTVSRLTVALPAGEELANTNVVNPLALSPDGKTLSYVGAKNGGPAQLYFRRISDLDAKAIPGTDGAIAPFFSPDGRWIGFFAQGKLKKVSISGGAAQVLCDAPYGVGGSWGADDTIYFAPTNTSGLLKVSASGGGTPQLVTMLDRGKGEVSHRWPQVLPGSKAVLFTVWTGPGSDEKYLELQVLATGERRVLVQSASSGRYTASGHLVYSQVGALTAVAFDLSRMTVTGAPTRLIEQVKVNGEGDDFAISESGELIYVPGSTENGRYLLSVNATGIVERLPAPTENYVDPKISPDGRYAAVALCGGVCTIAIYDFSRNSLTPLTSIDKGSSQSPVWSPDGKRIAYRGTRSGSRNIFWKAVDGSGDEERLTTSENIQTPASWSPDQKWVAFWEGDPVTGYDLWVLPLDGDRKPTAFLRGPFNERSPMFSPNGRYIAHVAFESGKFEIYVRPFPGPGAKTQISTEGGTEPVWSRDGKKLFYRQGDKLMAVDVHTEPTFTAGVPRKLFEGHYEPTQTGNSGYDVSPDGTRFLMVQSPAPEQAPTQINVVLNWTEELKQRVPVR